MKYVVVPEDVVLMLANKPLIVTDREGKETQVVWSHEKFVAEYICTNPQLNRPSSGTVSGDALRRVVKLLRLFDGAKPGDVIGVEDEDFKKVRAVVDAIEWTEHMMRFAHQMLPHIEAWEHAEKHDEAWKKEYDVERSKKPALRAVEGDVAESPKAG